MLLEETIYAGSGMQMCNREEDSEYMNSIKC